VQLPHALAVDQVKAPDGVDIDRRFGGGNPDVHAGDTWVVKVQEVVVGDLQRQGNRTVRELQPATERLLGKRSAFSLLKHPQTKREFWIPSRETKQEKNGRGKSGLSMAVLNSFLRRRCN
jgi:hypothetical protein